jgi:hypothetical protein
LRFRLRRQAGEIENEKDQTCDNKGLFSSWNYLRIPIGFFFRNLLMPLN